jgi:hypothetical protein
MHIELNPIFKLGLKSFEKIYQNQNHKFKILKN